MQDLSSNELRIVFGQYPTGVTVITALDAYDEPVGMTANSFASVSLSPPLILWSVDLAGDSHDVYTTATHFCVHLLAEDQQELANRFANREKDRFAGIDWTKGKFGSPLLPNYLCRIQCQREKVLDGGDHSIILGRVHSIETTDEQKPLVFHQGKYKRL